MSLILLVEDDRSLGATLRDCLVKEGFDVTWCMTKQDALRESSHRAYDLYVLDVGLPDGTGFELVEELEKRPTVFLTARADSESRLRGYDLGAEEYIPKPFHLRELLIRVRHVMKAHVPPKSFKAGDVRIDFEGYTIERGGEKQNIPVKDVQLLQILVERSPKPISRDEALNLLWGEDRFPSTRTVDNSIVRLRAALGEQAVCLESVRGIGYRWMPPGGER